MPNPFAHRGARGAHGPPKAVLAVGMKIMELCLSPGRGGLELYMARTVAALGKAHRVVAVADCRRGLIAEVLRAAGLPVVNWRVRFSPFPLLAAWRLARLLRREGVAVLHVHWRKDLPLAALAKRFCGGRAPRLIYTRQMRIADGKNDPYHNFIYAQVDLLLTISEQLRRDVAAGLKEEFRGRVRLLYYGTAPPRILDEAERARLREQAGIEPGRFVAGLFGQFMERKGQHLLLEALAALKREGIEITAFFAGHVDDPAYLARLREQARELNIAEQVRFSEFVKVPQDWMQICDCVVLTTYEETFGLVLIEAMSVGRPVIGSDKGGVTEIIDDGETGLLFESRNAESLAAKLSLLYGDRRRAQALGEAGRRKAEQKFSLTGHYEALEQYMRG